MLITAVKENFSQLTDLIERLTADEYSDPCPELSGATIGEHMRHIIEMYQTLEKSYLSGIIDYDKRNRDQLLQTRPESALEALYLLESQLDKPDKSMTIRSVIDGCPFSIPTNYQRELLYNLEHSIHHQALIKVGLRRCAATVSESFGVAKSTLEYKKQCAQ